MSELLKALDKKAPYLVVSFVSWLGFWGAVFAINATEYLQSSRYWLQGGYLIAGIILFLFTVRIDYLSLARLYRLLYIFALVFLALPILIGHGRWLRVGFLQIQPYEFAKIAIVIFFASFISKRRNLNDFWHSTFLPLLTLLPPIILLILQPHFGACVLLFSTALVMLLLRGVNLLNIFKAVLIGAFLLSLLLILAPYRVERIMGLFQNDPQGKDYQKNQSIIAIGSGGPWGKGLGNSVMKFGFLPEAHNDFLFAVAAEELGFFFTCLIILLPFCLFLLACYAVSYSAPSSLGAIIAGGLATLFAVQALINLGMVSTHLVPVVGLPLPFFTYGGSSFLSSCISAGIIYNIAKSKEGRNLP